MIDTISTMCFTENVLILVGAVIMASYLSMPLWTKVLLIIIALLTFIIGVTGAISIEQKAGYYECKKCHHKYVPEYSSVLFAMHIGRTRYMRCPVCAKYSWQTKSIDNE